MLSFKGIARLLTFGLWGSPRISAENWGDTPSIRRMVQAMPKTVLPDSMQQNLRFHKGYSGVFIGREQLLKDLVQMFSGPELERATADITKELPFGALVTNAPGVGKSALVTKLAEMLRAKGYGTIRISAVALTSRELLIAELETGQIRTLAKFGDWLDEQASGDQDQATVPPSKRFWELSAPEKLERAKQYGSALVTILQADPTAAMLIEGAKALNRLWEKERPTTAGAALRDIARTWPEGFVIIADECQKLAGFTDSAELQANLDVLCDPDRRRDFETVSGGILFAGLGSAASILDQMELCRVKKIWLPPLNRTEATERLEYAADHVTMDDTLRETIKREWVPQLTAEFHHWTHHVECAADGLSHAARIVQERATTQNPVTTAHGLE